MKRRFEAALCEMFQTCGPRPDDPERTAQTLDRFVASEGPCSPSARQFLEESGLRKAWNHTLRHKRSALLAAWLAPQVVGRVVDVFAGDLSVAQALARHVAGPIVAVERPGIADDLTCTEERVQLLAVEELEVLADVAADTAILCTALHHEPEPYQVLRALARGQTRRWLVVENCVDANFDGAFHADADSFFNACLNQTPLFCGPQHGSSEYWRRMLEDFGMVLIEESRNDVPGIFLPHTFFVVLRHGH